jgi:xylulokinase
MSLMGLDVGTTGCKATVVSIDGDVCSYAYKEYSVANPQLGWFELDPEDVWEAVKYVLGKSVAEHGIKDVTAICVSSFGEAAVPVDRQGNVLYNSLLYTDIRGTEQCQGLVDKIGLENIMQLTGLHAHPMYTINKLMWFKENKSEVYEKAWKFMLFGDYILYKLGNVAAIDYSLASRTMGFNVIKKTWEVTVLEAAGIDEGVFSEPVESGTVIGNIRADIADELGLSPDTKLVTGGHDQVCAAVGSGIIREGIAVNGIGTVECITPAFSEAILNKSMLKNHFACVPHAKKGMYVTYAFNFTGGSLLKWYRDNFAQLEKREAERLSKNVYAMLDAKASDSPTRILILPHFAGAGTPFMDTSAKGAILGLDFDTDSGDLYRAMLEGVTYEMMYNIECLEESGVRIEELRAVGGGAKSRFWLQIKADIMNRKITTLDVDEAGTIGTVIIAGVATGVFSSIDAAVDELIKVKRVFYPDEKNRQIYEENYEKYKTIYGVVKQVLDS